MLKNMLFSRGPLRTGIILCTVLSLLGATGVFALSLDLYHGNIYYARDDRVDTVSSATARRNNFYEDVGLTLRNPGATGMSFSSDVCMTNDKASGFAKQYEIRSTSLDWNNDATGLGMSLGRQFVNTFARDAGYVDGLSFSYDAGKLFSLSAFAGTANPSRYSDSILSLDPKAATAGFYGNLRIVKGTMLGLGVAADKQDSAAGRLYRFAASGSSDIAHTVEVRGHARFEATTKTLDDYYLSARLIRWDMVQFGLHAAGRASQIDSVEYYERIFLNRYNEGGFFIGLYLMKNLSLYGTYSLRNFGEGADHLADCRILFEGLSVVLNANTGVHGTMYEITPGYTFSYAQLFDLGAAFQYDQYKTELWPDWRKAYTAEVFMRWFVPWLTPLVSLVLEPEVQYLSNDYYKKDFRVLFMSRFNFHGFWQSGQKQVAENGQ
ncbi:MAG TPA: hypothetical protein VLX68_16550 [Chitinivibrionales bacterium]|nr:hypothetical protein [Chitinivibrionales bacterium]